MVYNCTNFSASGESVLVLAQSNSIDALMKMKMRLTNNEIYDNVNQVRCFNKNYACTNATSYGCVNYPNIIDGSGCYITRNNDRGTGEPDENPNGQYVGYFYFANNISYGNGINGLVVHKFDITTIYQNSIPENDIEIYPIQLRKA